MVSIFRTRPATNSQPNSLRISGLSGLEEEEESPSVREKEQYSRPHTSRPSQDIQKRGSWYRRFPIVPSSADGSIGSPSLQQPSTPSVFSNGSSATPFFGHTINLVTPRNKLVKRSTSHRGLHSEYPADSSFALTGKGPTFRRPATSHQRSETLRLRNAQQNLVNSEHSPDLTSEAWLRTRDRESFVENHPERSAKLKPFFRYQRRSIVREPGSGRAAGSKIFGPVGHIISVVSTAGEHAMLTLGNRVERPKMDMASSVDSMREIQEDHFEEQVTSQSLPVKKSRHSFSTERAPTASASWKLKRGGSLRKSRDTETRPSDRRIVSAPQQSDKIVDKTTQNITQDWHATALATVQQNETNSISGAESQKPNSSHRDSLGFDDSFTGSDMDIGVISFPTKPQPGLRFKTTSRRTSRVPSDRSTVFGSDNETSRVFSVDEYDTDHRSETVYDSVRTEASGSSHSGARNYRAENVFGEHATLDSSKLEVPTLHERLNKVSIAGSNTFIAEEEESIRTPSWHNDSDEDNMDTPSTLRYDKARRLSPSIPNTQLANKKAAPTALKSIDRSEDDDDSSDQESFWDDDFEASPIEKRSQDLPSSDNPSDTTVPGSEGPKSNIFEWSESQPGEPTNRPKTSHPEQGSDRGGRPAGRRPTNGYHFRSQSVPLPPDNSKNKFNNAKKLDTWMLGTKGASEDWDNDFEFDEPEAEVSEAAMTKSASEFVVPKDILDRQATVHGQFGQVKELTLLVEHLRRLHHSALVYGILDGQTSELWKEAAGIIDLATLDEEEPEVIRPPSPTSLSFDFDAFDDDSTTPHTGRPNNLRSATPLGLKSSPASSKQGTPGKTRPRHDSVVRVKNVLANIQQHRDPLDPPLEIEEELVSENKEKKVPFDTTSLRDLVIRAGVVTRACKEIIRKVEDPDYAPLTPECRPTTPNPPFFSQIFQPSSSTPGGLEKGAFTAGTDHVSVMTAV